MLKLLQHKESVTVIVRSEEKGRVWQDRGAEIAVADVLDSKAFRQALNRGQRLFLLNPPAPPGTDTVTVERNTIRSILEALDGAGMEKIVAQSTYGAQQGNDIGDLGTLFELEQGLKKLGIPPTIQPPTWRQPLSRRWEDPSKPLRPQRISGCRRWRPQAFLPKRRCPWRL